MLFHMAGKERSNKASKQRSRAGFILAGGKSSRMGTDKALLEVGGLTLLNRAVSVVGQVCDHVMVVGDPTKFAIRESVKYESVVADIFPGCGPLSGIHAALVHSTAELNLMLAVDMPFVSKELLLFLFATAENNDSVITVPRAGKLLQPLCAVYRTSFSTVAEQALRAGKYKIGATFADVSTWVIEATELAAAGFSEQEFFNVNTPQDRVQAQERDF